MCVLLFDAFNRRSLVREMNRSISKGISNIYY